LLAVTGLALLAFVAGRIGTDALVREIAIVRVGLPIIVVLSFFRLFCRPGRGASPLRWTESSPQPAS
jgi:hypothetical protein